MGSLLEIGGCLGVQAIPAALQSHTFLNIVEADKRKEGDVTMSNRKRPVMALFLRIGGIIISLIIRK